MERAEKTEFEKNLAKTIGKNLRKFRKDQKMSSIKLSEKCGIASSKIRLYEQGNIIPGIMTLYKLSESLNRTIYDIIGESLPIRCIHAERCIFYNKK